MFHRDTRQAIALFAIALSWPAGSLAAADAGAPAEAEQAAPDAQPATPANAASGGQTAVAAQLAPGHSAHGEAFNEGPRRQAYLMGGTGAVHFPITVKSAEAQQFFDQGVGQLHGFWYYEAERSFRQAAMFDPDCAMAYWGMAMANCENEKRAKPFIEQAVQRKSSASPREALWIDGLSAFLHPAEGTAAKDRWRQYIRSLEAILHEHPDDLEARAFLAVAIWKASAHDLPINSHEAVEALIREVLAVEPMHPGAHHYRIHLWDHEKPARAIPSAARCGQSAPAIAHLWHMSGHIFSGLHRYADAAWQQEASSRVDHAYMSRDGVLPYKIHNYAHNQEWLIRNLSNLGRVSEGLTLARNLLDVPRHPELNALTKKDSCAGFGRQRLVELCARYELWNELLVAEAGGYLEPTDDFDDQVWRLRTMGQTYFGIGDLERGRIQVAALEELARLDTDSPAPAPSASAPGSEKPAVDEAADQKAKEAAAKERERRAKLVEAATNELQAVAAIAEGRLDAAREWLPKVSDLPKTRLTQLYLLAGDSAKAEQLVREAVAEGPQEVLPLATYADVLWAAGKTCEAKAEFDKLRAISAGMDLSLPAFVRLAPLVQAHGLPPDWRATATVAADVGERPPLDSLGTLYWHPSPAPSWRLPGVDDAGLGLDDFKGRPVVMIFYLGFGCLHCVEQLKAFAPLTKDFAEAGITLVAISTENCDELRQALAGFQASQGHAFPFPLLPDASLEVFKTYQVYDGFEQLPLHGTFLIDGQGRVRWQDISFEPFNNPKFLLDEARRLLARGSN